MEIRKFLRKQREISPEACAISINILSELTTKKYNSTLIVILTEMSKDDSAEVRCAVAKSAITKRKVLEELAKDEDIDVREAVACNEKTSIRVLKMLSEDESWCVRKAVATNKKTPQRVLKLLAKDADVDVREVALKKSEYISERHN